MPEQIDELFVKLGLEQDKREFDQAEASFDSLRGAALQFGAVIGAGFGLNELTFGFAEATNQLNKLSQEFEGLEVTPQLINQLQGAFRLIDEDASEAESTIRNLAGIIEDTDWGQIPEDAIARGFDVQSIASADTMTEALAALNEQMRGIGDQEQARRMAQALGLSSAQFRLMRETDIGGAMQRASELSPVSREATQAAAEFQKGFNELSLSLDGVSGAISETFVGDLGEGMSELADIMAENRDAIQQFVKDALPYLKGAAAGIGTLVALRMGRAALGAFSGIPGATALAAGIGVGVNSMMDMDVDAETRENRQDMFDRRLEDLRRRREEVRRAMEEGSVDQDNERAQQYLERLNNQIDEIRARREFEGQGGEIGELPDNYSPGDDIGSAGRLNGNETSYNFNIDARGANDPQATEQAAQRGVERALARAAENTVNDFRSPVS